MLPGEQGRTAGAADAPQDAGLEALAEYEFLQAEEEGAGKQPMSGDSRAAFNSNSSA
jgi:hypothetical protein